MIIEKFQWDNYFKVYPTAWDVTDNGCVGLRERERERERERQDRRQVFQGSILITLPL